MEKVTIVFSDGLEIQAEQNGNCYIVDEKPDFPADLSVVTIGEQEMENVAIVECASIDGKYWFAFRQLSQTEIWMAEIEDALCDLSKEE